MRVEDLKVKKVWLLTCGTGEDGDEWSVLGIYTTQEFAVAAKQRYERPRSRFDGSIYCFDGNVEEWELDVDEFQTPE